MRAHPFQTQPPRQQGSDYAICCCSPLRSLPPLRTTVTVRLISVPREFPKADFRRSSAHWWIKRGTKRMQRASVVWNVIKASSRCTRPTERRARLHRLSRRKSHARAHARARRTSCRATRFSGKPRPNPSDSNVLLNHESPEFIPLRESRRLARGANRRAAFVTSEMIAQWPQHDEPRRDALGRGAI